MNGVTLSPASLAYDRLGRSGSDVLVLLHGLGSARSAWDPILSDLAQRFDVINLDLPGHGQSPAPGHEDDSSPTGLARLVSAFLTQVVDDRIPHVVGNSLGGWVGLELARLGMARSVVAFAPAGLWRTDLVPLVAHVNRWLARITAPVADSLLQQRFARSVGFWTVSAHPGDLTTDLVVDAARAHASARGWAAALTAAQSTQFDPRGFPATVPVTIVWGDSDRILPPTHCQERALAPTQARWVRLSNCGHVPMWDQPAASLELIDQTVARAVSSPKLDALPTERSTSRPSAAQG